VIDLADDRMAAVLANPKMAHFPLADQHGTDRGNQEALALGTATDTITSDVHEFLPASFLLIPLEEACAVAPSILTILKICGETALDQGHARPADRRGRSGKQKPGHWFWSKVSHTTNASALRRQVAGPLETAFDLTPYSHACSRRPWRTEMVSILPFLPADHVFDPDALAVMGRAFDLACHELVPHEPPPLIVSLIASEIIALAATRHWDAEALCQTAVTALTRGLPLP
jgi:hypothetical protein